MLFLLILQVWALGTAGAGVLFLIFVLGSVFLYLTLDKAFLFKRKISFFFIQPSCP